MTSLVLNNWGLKNISAQNDSKVYCGNFYIQHCTHRSIQNFFRKYMTSFSEKLRKFCFGQKHTNDQHHVKMYFMACPTANNQISHHFQSGQNHACPKDYYIQILDKSWITDLAN